MKQTFYCMLAVSIATIMLVGCKNGISQENFFKGEWDYTESDMVPNGDGTTTNYFVKCDLYEKFDLGEGYPRCYGIYQKLNEINHAELTLDSILYLSVDSAEVLASNIDYPEESIKLHFKYNEKDSTLTVSRIFQNGSGLGSIVAKTTLYRYNEKEDNLN